MSYIPWSHYLHFSPQNPLNEDATNNSGSSLCPAATAASTRCLLGLVPGIFLPFLARFYFLLDCVSQYVVCLFRAGLGHWVFFFLVGRQISFSGTLSRVRCEDGSEDEAVIAQGELSCRHLHTKRCVEHLHCRFPAPDLGSVLGCKRDTETVLCPAWQSLQVNTCWVRRCQSLSILELGVLVRQQDTAVLVVPYPEKAVLVLNPEPSPW